MSVNCKLSKLLESHKYSIQYVSDKTGLAYSTIGTFYHNKPTRIDYATIEKLCKFFNCNIEDLLEYVDD